ncbi:class C sortase [Leuconostoc koreense]|nr:class C sortase [Leuconostoc mesenteroides]QGM24539.1 class C sortase [Leuconostoc mesenteroides subsp. mesenteroides]
MTKRTSKKKNKQSIFLNIIFLIGFLVALYPFYVGALNHFIDQQRIKTIQKETTKDISAKEARMQQKNAQLRKEGIQLGSDPFSGATDNENGVLKKHLIGTISISKINVHIPLFDTTNEETLNYGATVLQGTSFPLGGKGTHSVISAHRGLASRMLFTNLNHVKKNDTFVLTVFHKKLAYKVFKIEVVKPENYQGLQVEPDKDLVTLITCTPYMVNSHRLLVTGYRIPYKKNMTKNIEKADTFNNIHQALIIISIILLIVVQFICLYKRIVRIKLAKKKFDLSFYRLDIDGNPVSSVAFQLFSKNKKIALKRDGEPLIRRSNDEGLVTFDDIPGRLYYVKEATTNENSGVIAGVKKLKDKNMTFYPTKKSKPFFHTDNNKLWITR